MIALHNRWRCQSDGRKVFEVELEFLFTSTMLVHIERLSQLHVVAKRSWALSDSFDACLCYRGYRFSMSIPFGNIVITALDADTPDDVFDALCAHVNNYRTVWPHQFLWGIARYFFLPLNAAPCEHSRTVE